jgi:hypothetical protein
MRPLTLLLLLPPAARPADPWGQLYAQDRGQGAGQGQGQWQGQRQGQRQSLRRGGPLHGGEQSSDEGEDREVWGTMYFYFH